MREECGCGCHNHEEKTKFSKKGDKITTEKCPKCNDKLVVLMDGGSEVFECQNCKFKVKKR